MNNEKNMLLIAVLSLSVLSNIYFISNSFFTKREVSIDKQKLKEEKNIFQNEDICDVTLLRNRIEHIEQEQMYFGTWKIVEMMSADYALPSAYSGFDEKGIFKGYDVSDLIGTDITIKKNYMEYQGTKYDYIYGPITISYPLNPAGDTPVYPEQSSIGYYYAPSTLGITGNYYSVVYFMLPDNFRIQYESILVDTEAEKKLNVGSFECLYIKDRNTVYISDGVLMFLMKRKN